MWFNISYVDGAGVPRTDRLRAGFCFASKEDVTFQFHQQFSIDSRHPADFVTPRQKD
jgi:hypothetical protein